jgi:hypothetical protein
MRKFITVFSLLFALALLASCGGKGTYYEQFVSDKNASSRVLDLNKSLEEIRSIEKGKLIKDDINLLKYVYEIGKNDTYIVSYLFDEKGCWEVGIDTYFEKEEDAQNLVDGIKAEISGTDYGAPSEDNNLCRWKSPSESASIELDYVNLGRGLVILTIMADK